MMNFRNNINKTNVLDEILAGLDLLCTYYASDRNSNP